MTIIFFGGISTVGITALLVAFFRISLSERADSLARKAEAHATKTERIRLDRLEAEGKHRARRDLALKILDRAEAHAED